MLPSRPETIPDNWPQKFPFTWQDKYSMPPAPRTRAVKQCEKLGLGVGGRAYIHIYIYVYIYIYGSLPQIGAQLSALSPQCQVTSVAFSHGELHQRTYKHFYWKWYRVTLRQFQTNQKTTAPANPTPNKKPELNKPFISIERLVIPHKRKKHMFWTIRNICSYAET